MIRYLALLANLLGTDVRERVGFAVAAALSLSAASVAADEAMSAADASVTAPAPEPILATAEWMLDQTEPRLRAAALIVLGPDGNQDRKATIIENVRGTTDGAAMLWLAQACRSAGIQQQCIDAGLDDAIVRYDSANLFARASLYRTDRIADLIVETRRESLHYFSLIEAWYEALGRGPAADSERSPGDRLGLAFAIGAAWATPAITPLAEACRNAVTGAELDRACQQLGGRLIDGGESMLSFTIGRAIQQRGESNDDTQRSEASLRSDRANCQMKALEPDLMALDDDGIREFIQLLKRHGEFEAWNRLAEQNDVDCSNPPTQSELIESYQRQFETAIESIALAMLESNSARERVAGLAYLLTADHPIGLSEDELLERLDEQIGSTTDPAALSWLASRCRHLRIETFCIDEGLDAAIIKHDRGNLLSRMHVLDRNEIEQALLADSSWMRSYASDLVAVWYAALESTDQSTPFTTSQDRLGFAMANTWSTGSPFLGGVDQLCTEPSTSLESGCNELAVRLASEGRTSHERLFGIELLAEHAEAAGDGSRADRLAEYKEQATKWMQCMAWQVWATESMDSESTEASLAELVEYGEWVAMRRADERLEPECDALPSIEDIVQENR